MDFNKLNAFSLVVKYGSFKEASQHTTVSEHGLRRQVMGSQKSVGTDLFQNINQRLVLTPAGQRFYGDALRLLEGYQLALHHLQAEKENGEGQLRISMPQSMGIFFAADLVRALCNWQSNLKIIIHCKDERPHFPSGDIDLALITDLTCIGPDIHYTQITTYELGLYATQQYLEKNGVPESVTDLERHRLIGYPEQGRRPYAQINWFLHMRGPTPLRAQICINSDAAILEAVALGLGIGSFSQIVTSLRKDIHFVRVLPGLKGPKLPVYLAYHPTFVPKKWLGNLIGIVKDTLSV